MLSPLCSSRFASVRPPRAWLLPFVAFCAVLSAVGPGCRRRPPTEATLLVSTRLGGVTAPCGCTSRPLGGLDRVARQVEASRAQGEAHLIVVGDTFFAEASPPPQLRGHSASTGRIIAGVLGRLKPAALVLGPRDVGPAAVGLAELPAATRSVLGLPPVGPRPVALPPVSVRQLRVAGSTLALLVPAADALPNAALGRAVDGAAAQARADGAAGVMLAWPHPLATARLALAELTEVDAVLAGDDEGVQAPEPLGSAVLLNGGARGEHLGALEVVPGTGGRWRFFDGGAAEQARLERLRGRMREEAERLPPGPARTARLTRAEALAAQVQAARAPKPTTAHFTWRLYDVDEALPKAAWATAMLDAYNQELCVTARADTKARTCLPARVPAETYVGSASCQACHAEAWETYEKTSHARAWATLTTAHKACDLSCVGCHVVGWEEPGGFCHLDEVEHWVNVGCESCHGPGRGHTENPTERASWGQRFLVKPGEETCRGCHNAEHSDQFDFVSYLPRVLGPGHGAARAAAMRGGGPIVE